MQRCTSKHTCRPDKPNACAHRIRKGYWDWRAVSRSVNRSNRVAVVKNGHTD
jgi:hypothetical protein